MKLFKWFKSFYNSSFQFRLAFLISVVTFLCVSFFTALNIVFIKQHEFEKFVDDTKEIVESLSLEKVVSPEFKLEDFPIDDISFLQTYSLEGSLQKEYRKESFNVDKDHFVHQILIPSSLSNKSGISSVKIGFSLSKYYKRMFSLGFVLIGIAIVFLITQLLLLLMLGGSITSPIKKLSKKLDRISKDPLNHGEQFYYRYTDEIEGLKKSVEHLLGTIETYSNELENKSRLAAIGETASMLAHDVRKPLSSVKAFLQMFPHKKNDNSFIQTSLKEIDRSSRKVNRMLSDVLAFSHVPKLRQENFDPVSLLTLALSEALSQKKNLNISFFYDFSHRSVLYVDQDKIVRLLVNIIDNAIDAMRGKGKIWFKLYDVDPQQTRFVIGNNGPCISPEVQEKIFRPYYTQGKKNGTGLGLSICRQFVLAHNGEIILKSKEGETEFSILLPSSKEGSINLSTASLPKHSSDFVFQESYEDILSSRSDTLQKFLEVHRARGASSLLVVDDEALYRENIIHLLQSYPELKSTLSIFEASNAKMAINHMKRKQFDYVISDVQMGKGEMNGYDLIDTLHREYPEVITLIYSNTADFKSVAKLNKYKKFRGLLQKPPCEESLLHFLSGKSFTEKKVLILNDDESLRVWLKFEMKKHDKAVKIFEASSVSEAKEIVDREDLHLILCDIHLGDGKPTGYDFLNSLQIEKEVSEFYFVSGKTREEEEPKAREMGATGFIQLPLEDMRVFQKLL